VAGLLGVQTGTGDKTTVPATGMTMKSWCLWGAQCFGVVVQTLQFGSPAEGWAMLVWAYGMCMCVGVCRREG
jgi:hypothetical protein